MKKRVLSLRKIAALFTAALLLISCASCTQEVSAKELSSGFSRKASETGEVTEGFAGSMADFSLSLFQKSLDKEKGNNLVSPLSTLCCLAMIANGTSGDTLDQIESVLHMDMDELNKALYAYTSSLSSDDDCSVNLANSIWFREDALQVNDSFLQTNADWYNAQVYASPFDNSTVTDINRWVDKQTDGMIDHILDEIPAETMMYLINALAFDSKWANEYEDSDILDREFHNYDGSTQDVQMLSSSEGTFLSYGGAQGFAKNYAGNHYSFVALLPEEGTDIYDYIASLGGSAWRELWENRTYDSLDVQIPEFTYSVSMDQTDALAAMGITDMFSPGAADFSAMGTSSLGDLYCSSVQQKTYIKLDRNGTKAAAVTWGTINATSAMEPVEPKKIILDRPFV